MESRTQGSRPKPRPRTQKKSEAKAKAKDSLSEDRHSRGQGQKCSRPRPRTKDTKRKCSPKKKKKKVFTKIFQAKAKDFKMCPRGRPRGQGRPRGLHLCLTEYYVLRYFFLSTNPRSTAMRFFFSCFFLFPKACTLFFL